MSRLTITLDDDLHRALKETAARQGRSITSIIEESLRLRGIQDQASNRALVEKASRRANLEPDEAMDVAIKETRATRVVKELRGKVRVGRKLGRDEMNER